MLLKFSNAAVETSKEMALLIDARIIPITAMEKKMPFGDAGLFRHCPFIAVESCPGS